MWAASFNYTRVVAPVRWDISERIITEWSDCREVDIGSVLTAAQFSINKRPFRNWCTNSEGCLDATEKRASVVNVQRLTDSFHVLSECVVAVSLGPSIFCTLQRRKGTSFNRRREHHRKQTIYALLHCIAVQWTITYRNILYFIVLKFIVL